MQQKNGNTVYSKFKSSNQFGVDNENNFLVLNRNNHVIGVDSGDLTRLILEDVSTGESVKFGAHTDVIYALAYHDDSNTLLVADKNSHVIEYRISLQDKSCTTVKEYGNIGIGSIYSSFIFLNFVFFAGTKKKVRVFDLTCKKLLPGHIETAIGLIYSLQVCLVEKSRIYLAVSGAFPKYTPTKTDLFDLGGLLQNVHIPSQLFDDDKRSLSKAKEAQEKLLEANNKICLLEQKIQKLENKLKTNENKNLLLIKNQELDTKLASLQKILEKQKEINLKLKDENMNLKESNKKLLHSIINADFKINTFVKKITILNQHKAKHRTTGFNVSDKGHFLLQETDPFVIIANLKEDLADLKFDNNNIQNTLTFVLNQNSKYQQEIDDKNTEIRRLQILCSNFEKIKKKRY